MSYGPPPSDKDKEWIQSVSDAVDGLLEREAIPLWRRVLNYPAFIAMAGAQVVRARWDERRGR